MIKGSNLTSLCYQGKVDFSVTKNGKKYHITTFNSGEPYLKYIFAKLVAGDLTELGSKDIPTYIEIWRAEVVGSTEKTPQSFTTKRIKIEAELADMVDGLYSGTVFTGYIPFDLLKNAVNPEKEKNNHYYIYLLSGDDSTRKLGEKNHKLAQIQIDPIALSYITPGTTATITWKMRLINTNEVDK